MTATRGMAIMHALFFGYEAMSGPVRQRERGSLIAFEGGMAVTYGLRNAWERGTLFIEPGTEVYEGMVIGNTSKGQDMTVNPTKGKQMSNMRSSGADEAIQLSPPIKVTLERGLEIMADEEYLEVTPLSVRLRKQFLSETERIRHSRKA